MHCNIVNHGCHFLTTMVDDVAMQDLTPTPVAAANPHPMTGRGNVTYLIDGAKPAAHDVMARPEFTVSIAVGTGPGRARRLTTDLSKDYVELNSAYST